MRGIFSDCLAGGLKKAIRAGGGVPASSTAHAGQFMPSAGIGEVSVFGVFQDADLPTFCRNRVCKRSRWRLQLICLQGLVEAFLFFNGLRIAVWDRKARGGTPFSPWAGQGFTRLSIVFLSLLTRLSGFCEVSNSPTVVLEIVLCGCRRRERLRKVQERSCLMPLIIPI